MLIRLAKIQPSTNKGDQQQSRESMHLLEALVILQQGLEEYKVMTIKQQVSIEDMVSNLLPKETKQLIQFGGADNI